MKKLITIALLLASVLTTSAQGKWATVKVEADELKGVKGGETYRFTVDSVGYVEITDWKKDRLTIATNESEFCYSKREVVNPVTHVNKTVHVADVLLGLYNNDGALLEKIDGESYFDEDNPKSLLVVGRTFTQSSKMKRMLKAVKAGTGYMRIVIKRVNTSDFDMKVTPYIQ